MLLRSQFFSGDFKLEAAAASDAGHIVPGARGDHVRKIQVALVRLDAAPIEPDGIYGLSTAAAVLRYKQKRAIINRSYQTKADNIVGKMTMASLDREMLEREMQPVEIQPIYPHPVGPHVHHRGLMLGFSIQDGGVPASTPPLHLPAGGWPSGPAPVTQVVVVAPQTLGSIRATGAVGGYLARWEPPYQNVVQPIARLVNGTNRRGGAGWENVDIIADPEVFNYQAGNECGKTSFQVVGPIQSAMKKSGICDVLVLVSQSSFAPEAIHPPDPGFKSGLVSTAGTPLNPLPGRRINIFGRGESNGFDDYSTSIKYCNDSVGTKPWTDDPRKPAPGIPNKSVNNICCRSSPIQPVTVNEIARIAATGCRVTFAGDRAFAELLRAEYVARGLAKKPIDEGPWGVGSYAIVFEFN